MGKPQATNLSDEINEAIMRNVVKNLRALIANPDDDFARGELMWASAMAENGMLKLGKLTDFQCHMIEHAVGAYTDCNHGQGLAVIHPTLYRHLLNEGKEKLARMAETVWGAKGETIEETAARGIDALELFIKEIGLPRAGAKWVSRTKRCCVSPPTPASSHQAAASNSQETKSLKY